MDRDDGLTAEEHARMARHKEQTANGLLGPGITGRVLVKPKKLLMWAKTGVLDPKTLPERLKETMLRMSTADTIKIIGDTRPLDDVLFAFETQRVDGARVPVLRRLLEAERANDVPRTKRVSEIEEAMRKALGQTKAGAKLMVEASEQEETESLTGSSTEE